MCLLRSPLLALATCLVWSKGTLAQAGNDHCAAVSCAYVASCPEGLTLKKGTCCSYCEKVNDLTSGGVKNPKDDCQSVNCNFKESECNGENQYVKKYGSTCGCCDACITLVGEGQDCSSYDRECGRRTKCNPNTHKCETYHDCPGDVCQRVKCGVRQGECQGVNQYIKKDGGICGCCDACATVVAVGEDCSGYMSECKSGGKCNSVTHRCEKM